jgi:hypothetical protein
MDDNERPLLLLQLAFLLELGIRLPRVSKKREQIARQSLGSRMEYHNVGNGKNLLR